MIHIMHEDAPNSATTQIWKFLLQNCGQQYTVTGYNGNQNLLDAVEMMKRTNAFHANHTYIILMDMVLDNNAVMVYYKKTKKLVKSVSNVYLADLLSMEYMILRFDHFVDWTKPVRVNKQYELLIEMREEIIKLVDNKISWYNSQNNNFVMFVNKQFNVINQVDYLHITSEQIVTKINSLMTNGGTKDFGVSKTRLGDCWSSDCCLKYLNNRKRGQQKCNLYKYKKTAFEKSRNLYNCTLAKSIVNKALKRTGK